MAYLAKDFTDQRYWVGLFEPRLVETATGAKLWYPADRLGVADPLWLRDGICADVVEPLLIAGGFKPHEPGECRKYRRIRLVIE